MSVKNAKIADKSQKYFLQNEKELRLKYGGRYVAIYKDRVVASSEDNSDLMEEIQEETEFSPEEVFIKYVRSSDQKVVR